MARSGYYRPPQQSEMAVFTKAKELYKAVFMVTQDAPKKFRFSLVSRLQDLSMAVVGHLYRANEINIEPRKTENLNLGFTRQGEKPATETARPAEIGQEPEHPEPAPGRPKYLEERALKRLDEKTSAMAGLKELDHLLVLAREMQCINGRQHEQLSVKLAENIKLLGGVDQG